MSSVSAVVSALVKVAAIVLLFLNMFKQDVRVLVTAVLLWVIAAELWLEYKIESLRR